MSAFLIDPISATVTDVEDQLDPGLPLLENVRKQLHAQQLLTVSLAEGRLVMFIDNFGLLKPGNPIWKFEDHPQRYAGRALMFAVYEDGGLAPLNPDRLTDVQGAVVFEPEVSLLRVEEMLLTEPGRAPMVARVPIFSDNPEPPVVQAVHPAERTVTPLIPPEAAGEPPQPVPDTVDTGWVVKASRSGGVTATRYRLADGVLTPYEMRTAKDLETLREQMPPGMRRLDPSDDEPEDVLELWVA